MRSRRCVADWTVSLHGRATRRPVTLKGVTLSIVACEREERVVGAAVTSCAIAAGRRTLHVRSGVGAAVAQASSEIAWGEELLDRLGGGADARLAIEPFKRGTSQVAVIDFSGAYAVHTGEFCDPHAGHASARDVVAQANTAAQPDAWQRMIDAYLDSKGPLAERMVAALAASGGDARGQQAAAVIVTGTHPLRGYPDEPHVDLRVDDHRDPVAELQRLLALHRAHCTMRAIDHLDGPERIRTIGAMLSVHPGDPHLESTLRRLTSSTGADTPP